MIKVIRIEGNSMSPFYTEGDYVWILKYLPKFLITPGMVLVFRHPVYGNLIKKVTRANLVNRYFYCEGANGASLSSTQIGKVPFDSIIGTPFWRVRKRS